MGNVISMNNIDLSAVYNRTSIGSRGARGDADGSGYSFDGATLPRTVTYNGVDFRLAHGKGGPDTMSCQGQTLKLKKPLLKGESVYVLCVAVNGCQAVSVTSHHLGGAFTQCGLLVDDWCRPFESNIAFEAPHRLNPDGEIEETGAYLYVCELDTRERRVNALTFGVSPNFNVLALSIAESSE